MASPAHGWERRRQMSRRRERPLIVALSFVAGALLPASASAGGFLFYEVGTAEIGLASAGAAARASSPSTLLTNPAGMVRLEGTQVQVGTSLVYGHLQFAPDSQTDARLGTNDGGNAVGVLPSFGAFASFFSRSSKASSSSSHSSSRARSLNFWAWGRGSGSLMRPSYHA